jgi:hypothetical protein
LRNKIPFWILIKKAEKIYARDLRYFAELNESYKDASVKETDGMGNETYPNAFDFTLLVSFNKGSLVRKLGRTPTPN